MTVAVDMIENIRRIGIFMITAQTAIHFAAGKQYEKYMKSITGVIILLMFIKPFVADAEKYVVDWQMEIERMERQIQAQNSARQELSYVAGTMETMVLRQIEEEIKSRLDELIIESGTKITDVEIDLMETSQNIDGGSGDESRSLVFQRVKVTVQDIAEEDSADTYDDGIIRIEDIRVGQEPCPEREKEQDLGQNTKAREYQHLFAQTLGIGDDKVEVIYRGGR